MRTVLLLLATTFAACVVEPPRPRPHVTRGIVIVTARGDPLPALAGELLEPLMRLHADDLAMIRHAIAGGDHDQLALAAHALIAKPRLARATPTMPDTINAELPEQFFVLQDRMLEAGRRLETAATSRDDRAIDGAYDDLQSTCVACHTLYRRVR
jgi:hypothetical protein